MEKKNCWEIKKCGREPGGENVDELGVCPAATCMDYDGINEGRNSGRFCWAVAGTYCEGTVQGTYASKLEDCLQCEVLKKINNEESREFILTLKAANKKKK